MAEPARAVTRAAVGVRGDVEDDVVGMRGVTRKEARGARHCRQRSRRSQVIQAEEIPGPPSDVVIGA